MNNVGDIHLTLRFTKGTFIKLYGFGPLLLYRKVLNKYLQFRTNAINLGIFSFEHACLLSLKVRCLVLIDGRLEFFCGYETSSLISHISKYSNPSPQIVYSVKIRYTGL